MILTDVVQSSEVSFAIYVALFAACASLITTIISAIINYKTIKIQNSTSLEKLKLENLMKSTEDSDYLWNTNINEFIQVVSSYAYTVFTQNQYDSNVDINFASSFSKLYAICNDKQHIKMKEFHELVKSTERELFNENNASHVLDPVYKILDSLHQLVAELNELR